jgi:hypothetical protein
MAADSPLLALVHESWAPIARLAGRVSAADLQLRTAAGWTVAELLAHLAFWDEAVVPVVTTIFRRQPLPLGWQFGSGYEAGSEWPAANVHNAREAAWARTVAGEAVRARLKSAHDAMLSILETFDEEEARAHGAYLEGIARHYREHLPELMSALGQPG